MLEIKNLTIEIEGKKVVRNLNLNIASGEVHAIMGENGSGKSSLAFAIMGHPKYKVVSGKIFFKGKDITKLSPDKRAKLGIFLSMQNPINVEGLRLGSFMWNSAKSLRNAKEGMIGFIKNLEKEADRIGLGREFISRDLNFGFSGGEKKKSEILQMKMLKPQMAIVDEIDSGLDIDSLKIVAQELSEMRSKDRKFSAVIITHYRRILDYVKPDFVHIMINGKIVKSGGTKLIEKIESKGYSSFKNKKIKNKKTAGAK